MRYLVVIVYIFFINVLGILTGCEDRGEVIFEPPPLTEEEKNQETVGVAIVSGIDEITHTHVVSLLMKHNIECNLMGSVIYGVSVRPKDYEKAWYLLKKDSEDREYWIELRGEKNPMTDSNKWDWEEITYSKHYNVLLQEAEFAENTAMGELIRQEREQENLQRFPYIDKIQTYAVEHLAHDGKLHTGYWVRLYIMDSLSPNPNTGRFRYQVYYDGQEWKVRSIGGAYD
jgi:hypothetical protein